MPHLPPVLRWLLALGERLAPPGRRSVWRREWEGEIWYALQAGRGRFEVVVRTVWSLVDAVWMWRRVVAMDGWTSDLRAAWRSLRRAPGTATVVVVSLALGIGANTAIFAVVDGVLLRELPVPEPERVVHFEISQPENGIDRWSYSYAQYREVQRGARRVETAVASLSDFNLVTPEGPTRVTVARVSDTFFPVSSVLPALGRAFTREEEASGARLAVVSHEFWERSLSGSESALGRALTLGGELYEVIGVMPPGADLLSQMMARGPGTAFGAVDVYLPLEEFGARQGELVSTLRMLGRLEPGATLAEADREVEEIVVGFLEERGRQGWVVEAERMRDFLVGTVRAPLMILMGSVALLLLMVCANLSGLFLVRGVGRAHEWAARKALGAGRGRIARQVLVESGLLSALGALLGVALAHLSVAAVRRAGVAGLPRLDGLAVDGTTVLFSVTLAGVATLVFGAVPALSAARRDPSAALTASRQSLTRRGRRFLTGLVAVEVALAVVLLVGGSVLLRSLGNLMGQDPGYEAAGVLQAATRLEPTRYTSDAEIARFSSSVLERLEAIPGVVSAAVAAIPDPAFGPRKLFQIDGLAGEENRSGAMENAVSPGYFETLGIEVLAGRGFTEADGADAAPVTVVTRALAERTWPGEDAVGRWIETSSWRRFNRTGQRTPAQLRRVVGVVEDLREVGIDRGAPSAVLFSPMAQDPWLNQTFLLRTSGPPGELATATRAAIQAVDPAQPVFDVQPMIDGHREAIATERLTAQLLTSFALAALLLAVLGIWGVVSYSVVLRRREIGIRLAVGADAARVSALFFREGLRPVVAGLAAGGLLSLWGVRLLDGMLYGVAPEDPASFLAAAGILATAALASTYLPARRTARVDPSETLRGE